MSSNPEQPDETPESTSALSASLKGALRVKEPVPDLLTGFQRKIRERSSGKFYANGWSTSRHAPLSTYLATSVLMLVVMAVVYAVITSISGEPRVVDNEPDAVQVLPPAPP